MKTDHQVKSQTGREHEVGSLSAPLLNFDLNREIQQLRSEGRWQAIYRILGTPAESPSREI